MRSWPPDLTLMMLALLGAVLSSGAIYLLIEVKRPLQSLERALSRVGEGSDPDALPSHGAPEVQSITQRFNAMVQRLAATRRERDSMLAGIAHDLRAPITRLQFRLSLLQLEGGDQQCLPGGSAVPRANHWTIPSLCRRWRSRANGELSAPPVARRGGGQSAHGSGATRRQRNPCTDPASGVGDNPE